MQNEEKLKNEKRYKEMEERIISKIRQDRQRVFDKFPLLFTLLGTFGLVATFYGFEHLIDKVDLFFDNPFILLGVGILTLIFTGSLYSKLK